MIWLASYPRSGNKLVQQVLHYHFGLPVRTIYEVPNNGDIAPIWDRNEEAFVKTHELSSNTDTGRSIYIYRHPLDVYCSYARYSMHTDHRFGGLNFRESISKLIREKPFGGWKAHYDSWIERADTTIRFDDLIKDPVVVVESVLEQMALNPLAPHGQPLPKFSDLQASADWYYQTGRTNRYVQELSIPELSISSTIDRWPEIEEWLIESE
jgi:hypothetical protein